jgi:signal transduction histidine kinase
MRHLIRPLRRLQWKLTLSYALITTLSMLLVEILAIAVIFLVVNLDLPQIILSSLQQQSLQASSYFVHGAPDREALNAWLNIPNPYAAGSYQSGYLTVVNRQGQVIASVGNKAIPPGIALQTRLSAGGAANLHAVLLGTAKVGGLVNRDANGTLVVIVPIMGKDKQVQGALIQQVGSVEQANAYWVSFYGVYIILPSSLGIIIFAGILGIISGFLTARSFTRRFKKLSLAADNWSRGDFSVFADDSSADELGQLTRRLNGMAAQLQLLLATHQKLASLEERNRLARDLHDSVKQQIFAVAMQLGVAKTLLKHDVDKAQEHLNEAESLVRQTQQELTALIRELRPAALEDKGFVAALRELVTRWSQQTGIAADMQVEGERSLPLLVEEALFRVAQEALANVARHSQAASIQVQLQWKQDEVILSLSDNGQGFDVAATAGQGVGLLSMQERMKSLGGNMSIESVPGQGTSVTARYEHIGVGV